MIPGEYRAACVLAPGIISWVADSSGWAALVPQTFSPSYWNTVIEITAQIRTDDIFGQIFIGIDKFPSALTPSTPFEDFFQTRIQNNYIA
jgi:hypothetical protein